MFNRYTIELPPPGEPLKYSLVPDQQIVYSARFLACECGCVYTEPIVYMNGNIKIILLIEGSKSKQNLLHYCSGQPDEDLSGIPARIANFHNIEISPIEHSINRAKKIKRIRYGRELDIVGCPGEAVTN